MGLFPYDKCEREKKKHSHKDWQATQKGQNITDI